MLAIGILELAHWSLSFFWVVLFFSLSIGVHEYGHLVAAFWRGLHVEVFSIGFGPAIKKWRYRGIDYQFSWIPLGGYVALPQLDPGDEPRDKDGNLLPIVKPLDRIIVAVAGPVFNILFALLLGCAVWIFGVMGLPEGKSVTIGMVVPEFTDATGKVIGPTPEAAAGLQPGDVLLSVNGEPITRGWKDAHGKLVLTKTRLITLGIERDGQPMTISYKMVPDPETEGLLVPHFGPRARVRVAAVTENSPAAAGGLKAGDYVVKANGQEIYSHVDFIAAVQRSKGAPLTLEIEREKKPLTLSLTPQWEATQKRYMVGAAPDDVPYRVLLHPSPWQQVVDTVTQTKDTVQAASSHENTVGPRNFSSVLGIVAMMAAYFMISFMNGVAFVVFINVSLAILNLLPLPILDGGHITLAMIELVVRRRVHSQVVILLQYASAIVLIGFVLYVSFYDVGRVKKWFFPSSSGKAPAALQFAPSSVAPTSTLPDGVVPSSLGGDVVPAAVPNSVAPAP